MVPFVVFLVLIGFCSAGEINEKDTDVIGGSQDTLIGYLDDYSCPSEDGSYPWDMCDKYVLCFAGSRASLMQCRLDHLFDLRYSGCNYPELTDCGNRTLPGGSTQAPMPTTTEASGGNTPSFVCPSPDGSFADPYDCSSFYICNAGTSTLVHCKEGLLYNSALEVCDGPANVDCSAISTIPSGNTTAPTQTEKTTVRTVPPTFVCPSADGSFSNPADCASFYYCRDGDYVLVHCQEGLLFNPELGICDHPEAVQCGVSPTSTVPIETTQKPLTTTTSSLTTATSSFSCDGRPNGDYPINDNCNSFYQCSNDVLTEKDCGTGLAFNPDTLACDFPKNIYPPCGTRYVCPAPEGYFPHPTDCTSFYVCSYGDSYQQFCKPPLVFNADLSVCDYTENVPPPCGDCDSC